MKADLGRWYVSMLLDGDYYGRYVCISWTGWKEGWWGRRSVKYVVWYDAMGLGPITLNWSL